MNSSDYLGLPFKPLSLEDQKDLEEFFLKFPQPLAWYTFAALAAWNQTYSYSWTRFGPDTILISTYLESEGRRHLMQPLGRFSLDQQRKLCRAIADSPYPVKMVGVSKPFIETHPHFCSCFDDQDDQKMANYLYKTVDLADLKGRLYEKKRNLISQGEHAYQWEIHPLTEKCRPYCPKILLDVGAKSRSKMSEGLSHELKALDFIMTHFNTLKMKGWLIVIGRQPAAFSIYERLNPSTAVVHFEKAEKKYKGLYQIINHETAKAILHEGCEYINREEDLGIPGLRQAKKSYHPVELVQSHVLKWNNNCFDD